MISVAPTILIRNLSMPDCRTKIGDFMGIGMTSSEWEKFSRVLGKSQKRIGFLNKQLDYRLQMAFPYPKVKGKS